MGRLPLDTDGIDASVPVEGLRMPNAMIRIVLISLTAFIASCSWSGPPAPPIPKFKVKEWPVAMSHSERVRGFEKKMKSRGRAAPAFEVLLGEETNPSDFPKPLLIENVRAIESQLEESFPDATVIAVKERDILSEERHFGMEHAANQYIILPRHLREANAVLFYDPGMGTLRLIDLKTNALLWQGIVPDYRIHREAATASLQEPFLQATSPQEPFLQEASPPPPPSGWNNIWILAGIGGAVTTSILSGYGVTDPQHTSGALALQGQVLATRKIDNGVVLGFDGFYFDNFPASLPFDIPVVSSHAIGDYIYGGAGVVGYELDRLLLYGRGGFGEVEGVGDASGLSGSGPHGGAGVLWAISDHWGTYFQWDIQASTFSTPSGSTVNAGTSSSLPRGIKDYLTANDFILGLTYSFWTF